jgi:hypothetical protein
MAARLKGVEISATEEMENNVPWRISMAGLLTFLCVVSAKKKRIDSDRDKHLGGLLKKLDINEKQATALLKSLLQWPCGVSQTFAFSGSNSGAEFVVVGTDIDLESLRECEETKAINRRIAFCSMCS